jgi:hypothetical protein
MQVPLTGHAELQEPARALPALPLNLGGSPLQCASKAAAALEARDVQGRWSGRGPPDGPALAGKESPPHLKAGGVAFWVPTADEGKAPGRAVHARQTKGEGEREGRGGVSMPAREQDTRLQEHASQATQTSFLGDAGSADLRDTRNVRAAARGGDAAEVELRSTPGHGVADAICRASRGQRSAPPGGAACVPRAVPQKSDADRYVLSAVAHAGLGHGTGLTRYRFADSVGRVWERRGAARWWQW